MEVFGITTKVLNELVKDRVEELAATQKPDASATALDEIALLTSGLDDATIKHLRDTIAKTRARTKAATAMKTDELWEEVTEDIQTREGKRGGLVSPPESPTGPPKGPMSPQKTHLATINAMIQELRNQAVITMEEGE
tara:strand:- start:59 stop:472 length:414 start_codon:yes stop_codon:yes gene_type:complete